MASFRVLIVDDFEGFRHFVTMALQQRIECHVIGEAADGLAAVEKAQQLQPDLILLDIGLPNLSGIEVARCVRRLVPQAKILFLSVDFSPTLVHAALSVGALAYVHKQRAGRDLLPAIDAVLAGEHFVSSGLESIAPGSSFRRGPPRWPC